MTVGSATIWLPKSTFTSATRAKMNQVVIFGHVQVSFLGHVNVTRYDLPCHFSGKAIGTDATFKVAKKAAVVDSSKKHTTPIKGGCTTIINEDNEFLNWVCGTQNIPCMLDNQVLFQATLRHSKERGIARDV